MTQEAFKAWWYNEGSQAPYTHHDCEEHTMRMCEIAWANGAYKALAEHAMREVQRLGQEIEQAPVADRAFLERTLIAMEGVIDVADRKTDEFDALRACIIELTLMLYTTPPQRTWVGLTSDELNMIGDSMRTWNSHSLTDVYVAIEAKLKEKNT